MKMIRGLSAAVAVAVILVSVGPSRAQLIGDIDTDALKAKVEEQTDEPEKDKNDIVVDVGVLCNSEDITLTLTVTTDTFNGMIYPKGLSKNSTCMTEYIQRAGLIRYTLPLRSCNTMSTDVVEGVEYFNTVVVQPHRKLVTNQGRGYHVRCRYQTQEKLLQNDFNVRFKWAESAQNRLGVRSLIGIVNLSQAIGTGAQKPETENQ